MSIAEIAIVVLGLALFEAISSIDNAIVNADTLAEMTPRARRWFRIYGIIIAVVLVRGLLPLLIVWGNSPNLSLWQALTAMLNGDVVAKQALADAMPALLSGGGLYLLLTCLHWFFLEKKDQVIFFERHVSTQRPRLFWFAIVLLVAGGSLLAWPKFPAETCGALVGFAVFLIATAVKNAAHRAHGRIRASRRGDIAKIIYLEILDAAFSIDGVIGAFAFTAAVPLILVGNGLGAYAVRWFTVHGGDVIRKYRYLRNGAMYSIGFLGLIMLLESLSVDVPVWLPTLVTFAVVGLFLRLSLRAMRHVGHLR